MRFKDMDLEAAFGSAFEAAGGEAFGDAWAREEAKIESAFGSAFEAADDIADLRLQGAWGDDVYAAPRGAHGRQHGVSDTRGQKDWWEVGPHTGIPCLCTCSHTCLRQR